jgi:hypothetical protein
METVAQEKIFYVCTDLSEAKIQNEALKGASITLEKGRTIVCSPCAAVFPALFWIET